MTATTTFSAASVPVFSSVTRTATRSPTASGPFSPSMRGADGGVAEHGGDGRQFALGPPAGPQGDASFGVAP